MAKAKTKTSASAKSKAKPRAITKTDEGKELILVDEKAGLIFENEDTLFG
jgi:hypothetical protein